MLVGNIFFDALAAMGCVVFLLGGAALAAAVALAKSEAGKALVAGLLKPKSDAE